MNERLDAALRSLDVAPSRLTLDEDRRGAAALESIIATDPTTGPSGTPAPRRRHRRRRLLFAGAVTGVAAATGLVLLQGVDGGAPAYASWTATPTAVPLAELGSITPACRDAMHDDPIDFGRAKAVLAERRGQYVTVLYRTDNPDVSGACLVRNPAGTDSVDFAGSAVGGSSGPAPTAPPQGLVRGSIAQFGEGTVGSIADGVVGNQVAGVTIHSGGFTVRATVENGRYTAWWPGRAFPSAKPQPDGPGGPQENLTYDLTLANGTVLHHITPARPA